MATGGKIIVIEDSSDVVGGCVTLRSCEPCMKDNTSTDATQFCTVCNEFLCDDCKRGHSRFKPGKHSFTIAQDVTEVKVAVDMKDMDKCDEHKKKIKFFCKDHSLLCCSTCAFIHRTCKNVDELAKISEEKGELLHELKKDLVQAAGKESEIINDCIQTKLSLQEKLLELPKEIEELRETLNTLFANTITVINNQANDAVRDETKRLSERQTLSEKVLNDINDVLPVCTAVVDNGTPQQVFILARSIEKKLNEINIHDDKLQSKHFTLQLSLNFTKEISTLLQTGSDFVKLESLRMDPNTDTSESYTMSGPLNRADSTATIAADKSLLSSCDTDFVFPYTLELLASIDIKQEPSDKEKPCFGGMDFLPDGRLVAVDNKNCRCLIMDDRLQRQGTPYTFTSVPLDVICVSPTDLAVTVYNKRIVFLVVDSANKITRTKIIKTSTQFYSMCLMQSSIIAATTIDDLRSVRMISFTGKETDFDNIEFPRKTYQRGDSKCAYVQSLNKLVLTDRFDETVYVYDTVDGTSKVITNKSIKRPEGVSVGPSDTVMLCCSRYGTVMNVTVDGDILGVYPIDLNHQSSCTLCTTIDGLRLAVTNRDDERVLRLYKYCKRESS